MPLKAPVTKEFEMIDAGVYKARCIRVIDLGTHEIEYKGESQEKHKMMIMFELPETAMTSDTNKGKPFAISLFTTLSLHKQSRLRPLLVGWRGKEFTEDEIANFDMLKLLDAPALLNIIHTESDGKTYANIASIMPLKRSECPKRYNDLVGFSLSDYDVAVFKTLSDKIQEKIKASAEFKEMLNPKLNIEETFGNQDVYADDSDNNLEPAPF